MAGPPSPARRIVAGVTFAVAAMVLVAVPWAGAAPRQSGNGPLTLTPSSGPAGSSFTGSQSLGPNTFCPDWFFRFDGSVPSGHDTSSNPTRSASLQVPLNAADGNHTVVSFCVVRGQPIEVGQATFVVTGGTTTTTSTTQPSTTTTATTVATTTTAATTTAPTTTRPPTTTAPSTTRPPTTTTRPPTTTSPTTTSATTTVAPTTTLASTTTTAATTTTSTTTETVRVLEVDEPTVPPGGEATATGQGCDPGATVTLEIAGEEVGTTTADDDGNFETEIDVPDMEPGRVEVLARCGPVLTTELDIVLASEVSSGTSTVLVLMFFLIVLAALLWYGRQARQPDGR